MILAITTKDSYQISQAIYGTDLQPNRPGRRASFNHQLASFYAPTSTPRPYDYNFPDDL